MSVNTSDAQKSPGGPGHAAPQKRKSIRVIGSEKKIGEDEFMAAAIGDVEWLKQSVRGNRGVINYDKNGLAPLHLAAIHGRLECLKLLIEKSKVDVNLPSKTGWRPIHLVISNQTGKRAFQCLSYLLDHGADPVVCNEDDITPMHQAASEGHVQCLKALIEIGASVKGLDYRGHTPLDLAKLWGHRKCARILATEEWHQDKEFLAKEMNQLEKLKMQNVLREIEADQDNKAQQEFYGDLAFKEWLNSRGLEPKPTGPRDGSAGSYRPTSKEAIATNKISTTQQRRPPNADTVYKANSVQRPPAKTSTISVKTTTATTVSPHKNTQASPPKKASTVPPPPPPQQKVQTSPSRTQQQQQKQQQHSKKESAVDPSKIADKKDESPSPRASKQDQLMHPSDWNKSTKIQAKNYVPILKDHYPHDEYTMLPKHPPKRYVKTPTMSEHHQDDRQDDHDDDYDDDDEDDDDTGDDRYRSTESAPPRQHRAVVYKCKHIGDVHKKKHYDEEFKPKSELAMHLVNDPRSGLFRKSLLTVKRSDTEYLRELQAENNPPPPSMDLTAMMAYMERMTKPTHFPPIKGAQYDLHVEQKV